MTPEEKLGNLIREYREKLGLLLQDLGKRVDVNYTHISYIEKGMRAPSDELLAKLAHELAENEQEEKELRADYCSSKMIISYLSKVEISYFMLFYFAIVYLIVKSKGNWKIQPPSSSFSTF